METTKHKFYLYAIIFFLAVINLTIITKVDTVLKDKPFTYEDGVALYNICQKHGGQKDTLVKRVYEGKNTDFREYILGK